MTLSDAFSNKSRTEIVEEIMHPDKELKAKNEEIAMLKKRILLYKSMK